ncbi:von Willebrand factor type A domain-containing protein [Actinomadura sp. ATCC 31491]|uniref:von Willebrand factor type A domain-containing protein n=1 Tax=Actinomadura luzonensis TaxID=2805427 RepID=A0ABT0FZR2_9ACTN|nr:von Willebrand factor type A domain-containing protein [Actinomadura luzonensis]MCK2217841.1 von Willebrand factor type A domain-containing protein [Actinomadura luzonensis]
MRIRPSAVGAGLVAVLVLAGCGGSGGSAGSAENAPKSLTSDAQARPQASASAPEQQDAQQQDEQDTTTAQISTFALDVDTASYGYARRALGEGRWPEPGRIRPEEWVNAFRQDYEQPPDDGFAVHVDGALLPGGRDEAVLRVGLQTRASDAAARRPVNLTFVVDVSGSMAEAGRLDLVKSALDTLLDQLAPGDQVSIVSFSDQAEVLASMTPLTARGELKAAVDRLVTEGGTNLESGLVTGYQEASKAFRPAATNRVILLSDGLANQGDTQWQGILGRVKEYAARQVALLTVGVGREYGDALMEQLADNGDGMAVYVSSQEEADKIFTTQLTTTIELRARDAKAQVVFNPSVVRSYRLIGYENRALTTEEFRDDSRDGGEIGPGHAVTALYSLKLKPGARGQLAQATVRWQDPDTREASEAGKALQSGDLAENLWATGTPVRLQVDVLVAAFAGYLRDRQGFGLDLPELSEHAARLASLAEDPMVSELTTLIGKARSLG